MPEHAAIYQRLDEETDKAYRAFCIFVDLGPDRSYADVANKLSVSSTNVRRWAKKNDWKNRASAYDNHLQEALTEAKIESEIDIRTQMNKNISLLLKAQENEIIIRINEQNRKIANPDYDYRPASIRTISETGKLAMEHLTLLEPTDKQAEEPGDLFKLITDCREINASPSD